MIFIDGERKSDFKKEREILSQIFPNSFDVEKPAPIAIHRKKGGYETALLFKPSVTDVPVGSRVIMPPPTVFSVTGRIKIDGLMHQWNYSESFPLTEPDGGFTFKQRGVQIYHGMNIDPDKDFEKLVYLWFYSKGFTNNARANNFGFYEFVIPAKEAKERIEKMSWMHKHTSDLLVPESRMDYEKLKSIMTLLSLRSTGVEEEDRTRIYDLVVVNKSGFADRYSQAKKNAEAMEGKTGFTANSVSSLIKSLIKSGSIVEKDGMWKVLNKEGAEQRIITEVKGSNKNDKEKALIQFMSVSPEDLEYLQSL